MPLDPLLDGGASATRTAPLPDRNAGEAAQWWSATDRGGGLSDRADGGDATHLYASMRP